jgi:hypothetical protein
MTQLLEAEVTTPKPFDELHTFLAPSLQWTTVPEEQARPGYKTRWACVPNAGFYTAEVVIVMVQWKLVDRLTMTSPWYAMTRRPVEDNGPEHIQAAVDRLLRALDRPFGDAPLATEPLELIHRTAR